MRLIDGDKLFEFLSDQPVKEVGAFSKGVNKGLNIARSAIRNVDVVKPIDPETLQIVRELRENLERVTAERDSYKIFFENITKCGDCNDCGKSATCEFVPKVGQTTRYNCPLWTGR